MNPIYKILIIVATWYVVSGTPIQPEAFSPVHLDTITAFEGNCPTCADQVYNAAAANLWKLQIEQWNVIVDVKRDTLWNW